MATHSSSSRQGERGTTLNRLRQRLGKGTASSQSGTTTSRALHDMFPLPGLRELKETLDIFMGSMEATPQVRDKYKAVERRLQHMTKLMERMAALEVDDLEDYQARLDDAKRMLDERVNSGRIDLHLREADRNLDVLQDLEQLLNSISQDAQLSISSWKMLNENRKSLVKPIYPQEITNRVDLQDERCLRPWQYTLPAPDDTSCLVTCKRRSGKFGSLTVQWVTYQSERAGAARQTVDQTLQTLLDLSHNHISSVVGVTSGCGFNGIVFTAGSLTLADFLPQVGLRDAARCVLEWDSVIRYLRQDNYRSLVVSSVQVRDNGSILVIPELNHDRWSSGYSFYDVLVTQDSHADPALRALVPYLTSIIGRLEDLGSEHIEFVQKLATSKVHWSELQALELASHHLGLFRDRTHRTYWRGEAAPPFKISALDTASMSNSSPWGIHLQMLESLEPTLLNSNIRFDVRSMMVYRDHQDDWKFDQTSSDGWVTYQLHPASRHLTLNWRLKDTNETEIWSAFKQTARENASKLLIPLDSIYLCIDVKMYITIMQRGELSNTEELYFHYRPNRTSDPVDFWGYLSTNPFVEHGAARSELERRGWKIAYDLFCRWHGMEDDWEYRYESLLERLMEETPGGFVPSPQTSQARGIAMNRYGGFGINDRISEVN